MKKHYSTLILLLYGLVACESSLENDLETEGESFIPQTTQSEMTLETSKLAQNPFYGHWILDSYLEAVKQKRRVFGIESEHLIVGAQYLGGDVLHGYTFHEGGYDFPVKYVMTKNKGALLQEDLMSSLSPALPNGGFEVELNAVGDQFFWKYKDSLKVFRYQKVTDDLGGALIRCLFAGKYTNEKGKTITISGDQEISGFKQFRYVTVVYDFQSGIDFDALIFYEHEIDNWDRGEIYSYRFEGDQLYLRRIESDWENLEHVPKEQLTWKISIF